MSIIEYNIDPSVDGVTKALLKITESKFESQISSPLMDTIRQRSSSRSREDHMINDDIIENIVEVSMITNNNTIIIICVTIDSICSQRSVKSNPRVMIIWYIPYMD